ncbi:BZ3500_MvSof-1268-A1-R1_Chr6-3g08681 [Microbotryum saponariae]|uniref:BZ3500_MvSof-1268-A1-R1_Chr6-3g08681 protein n=1 Tax=Microbotryum saponariae TaxID=289078 RepID=A0A2X0KJ57_9BASI|nr:BZ3500_MvSof-1268-A1-R1_Chr6-3g08681 [Microbotryum saponariae]SDA07282.1 BZ3501_MvSof-1269-A2-R1_Chr6-2g08384 [Microbotryum saponariae]
MTSRGPAWTRDRKKNKQTALTPPLYRTTGATASSTSLPEPAPPQEAPYLAHAVRHHGQLTLVPPDNTGRRRVAGQLDAASTSATSVASTSNLNQHHSSSVVEPSRATMGPAEEISAPSPAPAPTKKKVKKVKKPVAPAVPDPAILDAVFNAGRNGSRPSTPPVASASSRSTQSRERDRQQRGGATAIGPDSASSRSMTRSGSACSSSLGSGVASNSNVRGPRAIRLTPPQQASSTSNVNEYPFPPASTSRTLTNPPPSNYIPTQCSPALPSASNPRGPISQRRGASILFETPVVDPRASIAAPPPAFESPPPAYFLPGSRPPSPLDLAAQRATASTAIGGGEEISPTIPRGALAESDLPEATDLVTSDDPLVLAWEADRAAGMELELRIQRDMQRRRAAEAAATATTPFGPVAEETGADVVTFDPVEDATPLPLRVPTPPASSTARVQAVTVERASTDQTSRPTVSTSATAPTEPNPPSAEEREEIAAAEAQNDVPRIARALSIYASRRFAEAAERRIAQAQAQKSPSSAIQSSVVLEEETEEPVDKPLSVAPAPPLAPVASTSSSLPPPPSSPARPLISSSSPIPPHMSPSITPIRSTPEPTGATVESSDSEEEEEEAEEDRPARLARAVTLNARRRFAEAAERRVALERAAKEREQNAAQQTSESGMSQVPEEEESTERAEEPPAEIAASEPQQRTSAFEQLFPNRSRFGQQVSSKPPLPPVTPLPQPPVPPPRPPPSATVAAPPTPPSKPPPRPFLDDPTAPPLPRRPEDVAVRPSTIEDVPDIPLSTLSCSTPALPQRASLVRRAPPVPRSRPGSMNRRYPVSSTSTSDPSYSQATPPPVSDINPSLLSTIPSSERYSLPSPLAPSSFTPPPPRPRRPAPLPPPPRGTTSPSPIATFGVTEETRRPSRRPLPVPPGPTDRVDAFTVMQMRENALASLENREPRSSEELTENDRLALEALQSVNPAAASSSSNVGSRKASNPTGVGQAVQSTTAAPTSDSTVEAANNQDLSAYTELDLLLARLDHEVDGNQYDDLTTLGEMMGSARELGASQAELEMLDVAVVELERRRIDKRGKVKQKLSVVGVRCVDCTICLARFKVGERAVVLPECLHAFHETCIVRWLTRSRTCALCRANIFPDRPVIDI